jgi:hypothetical protein
MREYNIENNSDATLVLEITDLISILKSVLIDNLNLDLDKLEVNVIAKYSNNRLHMALGADLLRRTDMFQYIQMIQDMKKFFGPSIFTVSTAIDSNILINKLFTGYEFYRINEDMSLEIYY